MRRQLLTLAAITLAAACSDQPMSDEPLLGPAVSTLPSPGGELNFAQGIPLAGSGPTALATPWGGMYADGDIQVTGKFIGDGSGLTTVPAGVHALGNSNTGVGTDVLDNATGASNTATGHQALKANTSGERNTAFGTQAQSQNMTGRNNTAIGMLALLGAESSDGNTAVGHQALLNVTGSHNTGVGNSALHNLGTNITGSYNVALGWLAGRDVTTGSNNISIGSLGEAGDDGIIRIGNSSQHDSTFIAGIRGTATGVPDAITVVIDSRGQLGTWSSSRRYKQDIADMGAASERLLGLRPVTFRYTKTFEGGKQPIQYGLIAEEVAEVFPELVVYDNQKQPETVKYHLLSTLLLNELQKQDARIAELEAALLCLEAAIAGTQR